jgi:hypothetical protein
VWEYCERRAIGFVVDLVDDLDVRIELAAPKDRGQAVMPVVNLKSARDALA